MIQASHCASLSLYVVKQNCTTANVVIYPAVWAGGNRLDNPNRQQASTLVCHHSLDLW